MIKHINVKPETHKEVDKVRADEGLKTFDEAIKSLLARPDFTHEEIESLEELISMGGGKVDAKTCDLCVSAVRKTYKTLQAVDEK